MSLSSPHTIASDRPQGEGANYPLLDGLRGAAALLVLASHARHFGLEDYASQTAAGLMATLFYGATALGHQAVIVFFVLSGFLISGSVSRSVAAGRWQWRDYLSRRLARLWTVLLPCLALTAAVDLAAIHLTGSRFYDGDLTFYSSGPGPSGAVYDPATLLANILFLQGMVSPVFGSNGPLWSLANEFWYYLLFAGLFSIAPARWRTVVLLASAALACSIGFLVDERLLYLWPAWLIGYGVLHLLPAVTRWRAAAPGLTTIGGITIAVGLAVPAALLARNAPVSDLTLALAVAAVVLLLATIRSAPSPIRWLADGLARISYSLYLSHFPVLAMLSAVVLGNRRLPFGWQGLTTFGLFVAVGLSVAAFLYWAFERHTARVRYTLARLLRVG